MVARACSTTIFVEIRQDDLQIAQSRTSRSTAVASMVRTPPSTTAARRLAARGATGGRTRRSRRRHAAILSGWKRAPDCANAASRVRLRPVASPLLRRPMIFSRRGDAGASAAIVGWRTSSVLAMELISGRSQVEARVRTPSRSTAGVLRFEMPKQGRSKIVRPRRFIVGGRLVLHFEQDAAALERGPGRPQGAGFEQKQGLGECSRACRRAAPCRRDLAPASMACRRVRAASAAVR